MPSANLVVQPTKYICNQVQLISAESRRPRVPRGTSRGTVASSMLLLLKIISVDTKIERPREVREQRDLRSLFVVCIIYAFDHIGTWKMSPQDAWAMMTSRCEGWRGAERGSRSPMASMTWHSHCLSWSCLCQMRQVVHEVGSSAGGSESSIN